jgi:xylulokinase
MSDTLLGIDIGTGSTKGILTDANGTVLATAVRHHAMSLPRPGWAEMDAEKVWWADVVDICREIAPRIANHRLAGMCVSGVGPCLLLCRADMTPLRQAILYGIDMRATAEIDELTAQLGEDALLERCGKLLSTQAVGPKMAWVRKHEPEVWQTATRWYNSSSYLAARLTGAYVLDHHTASQCDPLYDLRTRSWADDWAAPIVEHLQMPELVWPHELVGSLTPEAAEATSLPVGTPVSAGPRGRLE